MDYTWVFYDANLAASCTTPLYEIIEKNDNDVELTPAEEERLAQYRYEVEGERAE